MGRFGWIGNEVGVAERKRNLKGTKNKGRTRGDPIFNLLNTLDSPPNRPRIISICSYSTSVY